MNIFGWNTTHKDVVIADLKERLADAELRADRSHELANHNFTVASKLEFRAKLAQHAYDRLNLCPDHRDKVGDYCVVCQGERRARNEVRDAILQGKIDIVVDVEAKTITVKEKPRGL